MADTQVPMDLRGNGFSNVFGTIIQGFDSLDHVAAKGGSHSLLSTGMLMLVATLAVRVLSGAAGAFFSNIQLSTVDLAILIAGSIVLLIAGSGLRVLDRYMSDKAYERQYRLRVEAGQMALAIVNAAPEGRAPVVYS